MNQGLCIFEDEFFGNFGPLVYLRPVYDLRLGAFSLKERISLFFPGQPLILNTRPYLAPLVKEQNPEATVNHYSAEKIIFINGRALLDKKSVNVIKEAEPGTVFYFESEIIAAVLGKEALKKINPGEAGLPDRQAGPDLAKALLVAAKRKISLKTETVKFIWDLIAKSGPALKEDFKNYFKTRLGSTLSQVIILNKLQVYLGKNFKIQPFTVINAEKGPVIIEDNVEISSFSVIEGPVFIGRGCYLKPGTYISGGTVIGPFSKMAGEIEGSIIQGFANKQHHGFLGHSYLGEWVNLGAGTTVSDLKNTYGSVKVTLGGQEIDTGCLFLGAIIGDHVKTAINTSLTTGALSGVFANIFEKELPKTIPSFSWGGTGAKRCQLPKALEIAEKVMARRGVVFSEAYKKLMAYLYNSVKKSEKA